ncbi:MAG: nucleotidyltransferase family protein [Rubrobacteraceae bacterium]|nr:nucleotidyltransferase family protein [Rubrobacteraceae bacterium]MCL6438474.1 nucleotidyltransferase family protein [Rubrobacteraceae bacterium]
MPGETVAAIVLAAGEGSRFGGGKLFADFGGKPLVCAVVEEALKSPVDEVIVVVGYEAGRMRGICGHYGVRIVENRDWREGQSTSVRAGLAACGPEVGAAVVMLGDQPFAGAGAVRRLVEAYERGARVAVATYGGERRNPVLFRRDVWPSLEMELSGDRGARPFLQRHPEMVFDVECGEVASPEDVDTEEDLVRLSKEEERR